MLVLCVVLGDLLAGCTEDVVIDDLGARADSDDSDKDDDTLDELVCVSASSDESITTAMVDIVMAVDNSAGMDDEVLWVQDMLVDFYSRIEASGVDTQITLITAPSPSDDDKVKNGICIAAPLGSGGCPDDSLLPSYFHVPQSVASKDALLLIQTTFELWKSRIRANSQVHLIVVSDDNSDVTADAFTNLTSELTPPLKNFFFHTVSASVDKAAACDLDPPSPCCDFAAKAGVEYQNLAEQTGGVSVDLCLQDFSAAFEAIAAGLVSLRCTAVTAGQTVPM